MNNLLKNKKKITIIVIIILISLVGFSIISSTYSLFYTEIAAPNANDYYTGLLSIEAEGKSANISLEGAMPMEDSEGVETAPYVLTIINNGNLDCTFDVRLLGTIHTYYADIIDATYIKLKIDDAPVTTLASLTDSKIKTGISLGAKESIDISIRIWLDINTPNTEIGHSFVSNIVVDSIATYTETNQSPYSGAAETIYNLFSPNSTIVNNGITYNIDTNNNLIEDINGNIRYYGASPNNYISFNCETYPNTNCETWRIIGIVDGHLKLIRGSRIGPYSWDTSDNTTAGNSGYGINEWRQADLKKLLNPGYEYLTIISGVTIAYINNSQYYSEETGSGTGNVRYCYNGRTNAKTVCDLSSVKIKNDNTRNMIASVTYNTGAFANAAVYPNELFALESSNSVGDNTNDGITRTTTWNGRVAVPYPSDYAYAADLSQCNQKLNAYNNSTCTSNNWMKSVLTNNGGANGWVLNPYAGHASRVFRVNATGALAYDASACNAYSVVPVLYLKGTASALSGTGTSADPYRLGL